MKTPGPSRGRQHGFILVFVLAALAMMTLLLFALLGGSSRQGRAGENNAIRAREKMLADSAVALVIGQIQTASSQVGQAWISQPGLLRTYGLSSKRQPTACYKLYSAPQMIDKSGKLDFLATDAPPDWNSAENQGVYTDLNEPQSQGFFKSTFYPILDPAAAELPEAGVSYDSSRGVSMPVAWIYQLQDGSLGPAADATKDNPIVARLAFWTDDETSKININTAGCGSPWQTPRFNSDDDSTWSTTQPAAGEYPRYPGHPASTSLAVVFGGGSPPWTGDELLALAPRYATGGSEFGTLTTKAGEVVPPKIAHLYASIDELCFDTDFTSTGQRDVSALAPSQLETARFLLTAHSVAPETTLLGEPRIAIWPVSDAVNDPTRTTATDHAMRDAATLGDRAYLFQRHNALSPTDDLNPQVVPGNATLFSELIARGDRVLPGYGAALSSKYTGATWPQLMLEITDFIRGINAVDPSPAPFVSYASGDATGVGRGFIVPLTSITGATAVPLRGLGRCPTLSSLTIVFYVCGFTFDDKTPTIDYDSAPDADGSNWATYLTPDSPHWQHVTNELIRAFIVPSTFQPGCAFPEVSDACDIEIDGLDKIYLTTKNANDLGFPASAHSRLLSDALTVGSPERVWGGNEGPLAWRAASLDGSLSGPNLYPFAGNKAFELAFPVNNKPQYAGTPPKLVWTTTMPNFTFPGVTGLTVKIRDAHGNTLQTCTVDLPAFTCTAPSPLHEYNQSDSGTVAPSYYMNLNARLLATGKTRPYLIQPGDVARSVEAATDLRVIAGLSTVSSAFFAPHPGTYFTTNNSLAHNLQFADGTSAFGADGTTPLVTSAAYPTSTVKASWPEWTDPSGSTLTNYTLQQSPSRSVPITQKGLITMAPLQPVPAPPNMAAAAADWDTGIGFSPDGALINLPDAGTTLDPQKAYFTLESGQPRAATQRTPTALVPSPVIFGSLPAGIDPLNPEESEPWRTLVFSPYPAADAAHPGLVSPPDHLVLDNFWMPTVEPYAISTCLATAGKINLNDQIAPFTYLHRSTALRAVLHDLRIPALSTSFASRYKSGTALPTSPWKSVDSDATITLLEKRFSGTDAYLSESEICTVPLVPEGVSSSKLESFWTSNSGGGRLTGDNLRELPYAQIYSRLTTRSNSYTVHVRAQILKKSPADPQQNRWNETTDHVIGEWRGSYEIERYLDANAKAPDPSQSSATGKMIDPKYYHFRIVSSQRFAP